MPESLILSAGLDLNPAIQQYSRFARSLPPISLKLNEGSFTRPLGKITASSNEFNKSLEASNARVLAFGASAGLVFGVNKAFEGLLKSAVDVQKALTDINVIFNRTDSSLAQFGDSLFAIAKNTGQSLTEVTKAATELARQGLGVEETLKRTNSALILSRLSGLDTAESVNTLTSALNSFTKQALTDIEVVNKLAAVDASFAVSSRDLAQAVQRVGSTAQDAGVSLEELLGLVTAVQQTTSRGGAVIGNAFKTIFTRIEKSGTVEQLQGLGVAVNETQSGLEKLRAISDGYESAIKRGDSATANFIKNLAGGTYQINIVAAALNNLGKANGVVDQAINIANNAGNSAVERNKELNKTFAAQINTFVENFRQAGAKIGTSSLGPLLDTVIGGVNDQFKNFNGEDKSTEKIGGNIGSGIVKGIGQYITGPGAILAGGVLATLLVRLGKFSLDSLKSFIQLNKAAEKQLNLQAQIETALKTEPGLLQIITNQKLSQVEAERLILNTVRARVAEEEKLAGLARRVSKLPGSTAPTSPDDIARGSRLAGVGIGNSNISGGSSVSIAEAAVTAATVSKLTQGSKQVVPGTGSPVVLNPSGYNSSDRLKTGDVLGVDKNTLGKINKEINNLAGKVSNGIISVDNAQRILTQFLGTQSGFFNDLSRNPAILNKSKSVFEKALAIQVKSQAASEEAYKETLELSKARTDADRKIYEQKLAQLKFEKLRAANLAELSILEQKGSKLFGFGARRQLGKLSAGGDEDALFAKQNAQKAFSDKLFNASFAASIAIPIVTSIGKEFLGKLDTKEKRTQGAGLDAVGDIGSFAGLGASIGSAFGPLGTGVGAGAGAVVGGGIGLTKILKEFSSNIPELESALKGAREELEKTTENLKAFSDVQEKLKGIETGEITAQPGQITELLNKNQELINKFSTEQRKRLEGAAEKGGFAELSKVIQEETAKTTREASQNTVFKNILDLVQGKDKVGAEDRKSFTSNIFGLQNQGGETLQTLLSTSEDFRKSFQDALSSAVQKPTPERLAEVQNAERAFRGAGPGFQAQISTTEKSLTKIDFSPLDALLKSSGFNSQLVDQVNKILKEGDITKLVELFDSLTASVKNIPDLTKALEKFKATIKDAGNQEKKFKERARDFEKAISGLEISQLIQSTAKITQISGGESIKRAQGEGFLDLKRQTSTPSATLGFETQLKQNQVQSDLAKNVEQALQQSRQEFLAVIKNLPTGVKENSLDSKSKDIILNFANALKDTGGDSTQVIKVLEEFRADLDTLPKDIGLNSEAGKKIWQPIVNELDVNFVKLNAQVDDLNKNAEYQSKVIAIQADYQKQVLDFQKRAGFGGGISNTINPSSQLQTTLDALKKIRIGGEVGNEKSVLGGRADLSEVYRSFNVNDLFKKEITEGLKASLKQRSDLFGLNLGEEQIGKIADAQYSQKFPSEEPIVALSNQIKILGSDSEIVKALRSSDTPIVQNLSNLANTITTLQKSLDGSKEAKPEPLKEPGAGYPSRAALIKRAVVVQPAETAEQIAESKLNTFKAMQKLDPDNARFESKAFGEANRPGQFAFSPKNVNPNLFADIALSKKTVDSKTTDNKKIEEFIKLVRESGVELAIFTQNIKDAKESTKNLNESYNSGKIFRETLSSGKQADREKRILSGDKSYNPLKEAGNAFVDSLRYETQDFNRDLAIAAHQTGTDLKDSIKEAFSNAIKTGTTKDLLRNIALGITNKISEKTLDLAVNSLFGLGASFLGKNSGGIIGYSTGGTVRGGSGNKDDVPAYLTAGEFVIKKSAVKAIGEENLKLLNEGKLDKNIIRKQFKPEALQGKELADYKKALRGNRPLVDPDATKNSNVELGKNSANLTFKNAFVYEDYRKPKKGFSEIDKRLSSFALDDEESVQNARRLEKEQSFISYNRSRLEYEKAKRAALKQFKGQNSAILTQAYISAAIQVAGGAINASRNPSAPAGTKTVTGGVSGNKYSTSSVGSILGGFEYRADGGIIPQMYAIGGRAGGKDPRDTVPAMLTGGEFVVKKSAVDKYGADFFDKLNRRGYADGGLVLGGANNPGGETIESLTSAINELRNSIGKTNKSENNTPQNQSAESKNYTIYNSFAFNIDKSGNTTTQKDTSKDGNDDVTKTRKFSELIEGTVLKVITEQKRPGGLLT